MGGDSIREGVFEVLGGFLGGSPTRFGASTRRRRLLSYAEADTM